MQKATLDRSGVYSKKAELNLQLSMALQLHAARPAGNLPFLCTKYPPMHEISKVKVCKVHGTVKLALCQPNPATYYAQNYAGMIGASLATKKISNLFGRV